MADAMKLGDQHTAIMDAIHGDLLRQNPGAFVEEDGNATLVIPTKPFLTIDVSSLAEAVLPLAASPTAREEAPKYADELVNASMRRRDVDFGREEAPAEGAGDAWPVITDDWVNTYCELTGRDPDGGSVTFIGDGPVSTTFKDAARREIDAMLCAAPKSVFRNRTSEPEAGEVRPINGSPWFHNTYSSGYGGSGFTYHPSDYSPRNTPQHPSDYTHPAPATADKLRVAVEALEKAYRAWFVEAGESAEVLECVGPLLSALNEGGNA